MYQHYDHVPASFQDWPSQLMDQCHQTDQYPVIKTGNSLFDSCMRQAWPAHTLQWEIQFSDKNKQKETMMITANLLT